MSETGNECDGNEGDNESGDVSSDKDADDDFSRVYGEMDDDEFHYLMHMNDVGFSEVFVDEVFEMSEVDLCIPIEKCNLQRDSPYSETGVMAERIQSASKPSDLGNAPFFLAEDDLKLSSGQTWRLRSFDEEPMAMVINDENEDLFVDTYSDLESDDDYFTADENEESMYIADEILNVISCDQVSGLSELMGMSDPILMQSADLSADFKGTTLFPSQESQNRDLRAGSASNLDMGIMESSGSVSSFPYLKLTSRGTTLSPALDAQNRVGPASDLDIEIMESSGSVSSSPCLKMTCTGSASDLEAMAERGDSTSKLALQTMTSIGNSNLELILNEKISGDSDHEHVQNREKPNQTLKPSSEYVGLSKEIFTQQAYSDFLFKAEEIDETDTIWSILTDTLFYTADKINGVKQEEAVLTKRSKKVLLNEAATSAFSEGQQHNRKHPKAEYFLAANSNEPINKLLPFGDIDLPYEEVKPQLSKDLDPDRDVTTTYLWSESGQNLNNPLVMKGPGTWFPQGSFPITLRGEAVGHLMDGTPIRVKTLIDSGASKPILNKKFYTQHPFLHQYPIYKIKPRGIKIANGKILKIDECIKIMIRFSGHVFEMIAFLMDICADYDFVIGQKTMYELEGGPHFGNLSFHFMMRSIPLVSTMDLIVNPGESKTYCLKMTDVPPGFVGGRGIIKLRSIRRDQLVQTLMATFEKGKAYINAHNESNEKWFIHKGELMGSVDMRSLGYFHINRDVLLHSMEDACNFLTDEETQEYFCKLIQDTDELFKAVTTTNTRLIDRTPNGKDKDSNLVPNKIKDPYPWLEPDDVRRNLTDEEILEKFIDLSESDLTEKEIRQVRKTILRYKKAFSLRDEIGLCPNMEIELELTDTTPFFIRPFPCKENEKDLIDKEMRKGCLLGILKKGLTSYSSPIMLIPRKLSGIPRIVTDFRHLNSRLVTLQPSIPLVRDAIQILGASGCEVISVADLRDAYHTLRLSKQSQKYCGITPYYGSDTYLYQRLGMGLSVSPAVWQNFIQKVLSEIPDHRKHHLAIMDDCLVHSKRKDHLSHLTDLFKALIRNGLKISPKKCQFFRTKLVYMGHTLLIEDNIPKITPLKSRVEAILKLDPPKTPKNCKQFCGMVNYLSIFLKDLQLKLAPIYQLTRKGIPFVWTAECQQAFEDIKEMLTTPPVLVMPNDDGHFVLVSDTSIVGCGGALYQAHKGSYRLVAYYSKKLPECVRRYSISELELTGILANVIAFRHILKNAKFTVHSDHSALVHILQAKRELPTLRLKKLVEKLMDYNFKIKFLKGKEMYVSDFLSRHPDNDIDSPNEIIPIAFLAQDILTPFSETDLCEPHTAHLMMLINDHFCPDCIPIEDHYYCFDTVTDDYAFALTRSKAKEGQAEVPQMYPLRGEHRRPEQAKTGIIKPKTQHEVIQADPKLKMKPQIVLQPLPKDPIVQIDDPIVENLRQDVVPLKDNLQTPDIPDTSRPDVPLLIPPMDKVLLPKPLKTPEEEVIQQNYEAVLKPVPIDIRLTGKLPVYDMESELKDKDWMPSDEMKERTPAKLLQVINEHSILRRHVPKQVELDKFISSLKSKVIHDYNIPVSVKELRAEYPNSPFYQDIYKYIQKGFCRYVGKAQRLFKMQCEDYLIMEGVLFKIRYDRFDKGEPSLTLCVPEKYIPVILHQYHKTVLAGHPGVNKLYETIRKKYYFPGMYTIIRQYVISCMECQSMKEKERSVAIHYPRIPLDSRPMSRFSMDVKHMPNSTLGFTKILVCTCETTNWIVGIPMVDEQASTIADALYFKIICIYGTPKAIICDESPAFTSDLMKAYFHAMNIKPIYISPMNHGSNRTERYIKTMNDIICKHLTGKGSFWPLYVYPACYAMNTQVSLITGYSPYEMVYIQSPPDLFNFDFDPDRTGIKVGVRKYMDVMHERSKVMKSIIQERKTLEAQVQHMREMRRNPDYKGFMIGDLVYLYHGPGSVLQAPARKLKRNWIGPLRVQEILDDSHYLISDWSGDLIPQKVHVNRLKPCTLNLGTISDEGLLEVVSNTRDLFQKWREIVKSERKLTDDVEKML